MKKRMKKVDVLASVLLVGMVSVVAMGQVVSAPKPTPLTHMCPGFTVYRVHGEPLVQPDYPCPEGFLCQDIIITDGVDENGVPIVVGVGGACIDPV